MTAQRSLWVLGGLLWLGCVALLTEHARTTRPEPVPYLKMACNAESLFREGEKYDGASDQGDLARPSSISLIDGVLGRSSTPAAPEPSALNYTFLSCHSGVIYYTQPATTIDVFRPR